MMDMGENGSDPEALDDTRIIALRIAKKLERTEGAATVWRLLGGVACTAGLALAAAAYSYAAQAAVDHERVDRLEDSAADMAADLDAIRSSLARIEGRLEHGGE